MRALGFELGGAVVELLGIEARRRDQQDAQEGDERFRLVHI
jgi:hypothetical protein